ncbi:MAG: glutathione S-transferase family protein [Pseudomonadota bacterium]
MVMLKDEDIQTKEVLSWKGLHLFHHPGSSCSQKTKIFLRIKGVPWTPHIVNLIKKEQMKPHFLGINPRGLVPVLVHDGKVIIESNDILEYLEAEFPNPTLIPPEYAGRVSELLKAEDDLHHDIRALTMRFVFPTFMVKRPEKDIEVYEASGSGTVEGVPDLNRHKEATFWRDLNTHDGIPDTRAKLAFERFRAALDEYETKLSKQQHLAGDTLSVVDIAWYIYARRLISAGYPLANLHPKVGDWFDRMHANPDFRKEVPEGGIPGAITSMLHLSQKLRGTTLQKVVARTPMPA